MTSSPLVSIIVPTKNSSSTLKACLDSIKNQSYKNIELILIDNNSEDDTKDIARMYTSHVFNMGPERSTQRNYGVSKSKGRFVLIIDSDMELERDVVSECVMMFHDSSVVSIVIPELSFGTSFWAKAKALERSFYVGVEWMEAARAFTKDIYISVGGYNVAMISGEDWDLSQRAHLLGRMARISSYIKHNEGRLSLLKTLRKKFYYAQQFSNYSENTKSAEFNKQTSVIDRYKLFFKEPNKLTSDPLLGIGMLYMKTLEFGVGFIGLQSSKLKR